MTHSDWNPLIRVTRLLAFCGLLLLLVSPALAQSTDLDKQARAIYKDLMSPFCPGQSLYRCQSSNAAVLRRDIRERLGEGETREQIVASLVAEYGEAILGDPPNRGFYRSAWLMPVVAIVFGGLVVFAFLRRYTRRRPRGETQDIDPAMLQRIEKELETHDG